MYDHLPFMDHLEVSSSHLHCDLKSTVNILFVQNWQKSDGRVDTFLVMSASAVQCKLVYGLRRALTSSVAHPLTPR